MTTTDTPATSQQSPPQVSEQAARKEAEAARQSTWERPSFGKNLFLGRFDVDLVHPLPQPSEEERVRGEAFLERMDQFLRETVDPEVIERDKMIPVEVLDGLRDIGALGMKIDEEYGGVGLTTRYYLRALALAGSVHSSVATLLSAHQSIGVPQPLKQFGTESQKNEYLPRCVREISAFLLTEPDVGSDPARMGTTAVPTEDGSAYILDGVKLWTTNGVIADLAVVMAKVPRSEGHRGGISAFIVECTWPGVTVEHRNDFMGLHGIENGVTRLSGVRVPAENLVAKEGQGLKVALTTLNVGRLSLPAISAGSARYSLKIAREWSRERVQWGQPVGRHEAVAENVAWIAATAFGIDATVELSAALADAGVNDIRIEAAVAKLYSSELAWELIDRMIQVRGGRGYETAASLRRRGEKPIPAEQMLRDARIMRIFEGSSEIMRLLIAREAVDQHLSVAGGLIDPETEFADKAKTAAAAASFYASWLPKLVAGTGHLPTSYDDEFGSLARHLRYVERSARRLARQVFAAMSRWQGRLERKQMFLGRVVDIGSELYAITAACVYARSLVDEGRGDPNAIRDLADAFCRMARRRAEALFDSLWDNDDDADYTLAQRVLDGDFTWLEWGIIDPAGDGPMIAAPQEPGPDVRYDHPGAPTPAAERPAEDAGSEDPPSEDGDAESARDSEAVSSP